MFRVGIWDMGYPSQRMIINRADGCSYVQVKNGRIHYLRLVRLIARLMPSLISPNTRGDAVSFTLTVPKNIPNIYFMHTFGRVCLNDNYDWVATFENTLPGYFSKTSEISAKYVRRRLVYILSDKCKAIMPMSQWAYNNEMRLLSIFASDDEARQVESKMKLLYPPQECLANYDDIHLKFSGLARDKDKIRFLYVGGDLVRKGGAILLRAFDELSHEYDNFSVTVVGSMNKNYGIHALTVSECKRLENIINNASWLEYHDSLPNDRVLELSRQSHVGLLPTLGDTFGFSILEMQAAGCPVITTDREARPEIVNDKCGWLINTKDVYFDHGDDCGLYSHSEVETLSEVVEDRLKAILRKILDDPSVIESKAINSLDRIAAQHNPKNYSDELLKIYSLCR